MGPGNGYYVIELSLMSWLSNNLFGPYFKKRGLLCVTLSPKVHNPYHSEQVWTKSQWLLNLLPKQALAA